MKTVLATFLTILLLLPVSAIGEIQTITHTVKQSFGGSQSADDARISAVAKAKREALEMAGTYIESLTVVKNSQVDKDEILALAAGILKAEIVSQKNYVSGDAFGIEVVVKVVVDMSVLEGRVNKLLQDRSHLEQLNQARKKEKELLDKVAKLEEENRRLMAQNKSSKELQKQFELAAKGLTAFDWVNKAIALRIDEKYTDIRKAIEYLSEAIRLEPGLQDAYSIRGIAYARLEDYQHAIEDYNQVIRLTPDDAGAYQVRGTFYGYMGQHQLAIENYTQSIRLKPNDATTYYFRGFHYSKLSQYQRAITDYDEVIELNPENQLKTDVYYQRGNAYGDLGNNKRAIKDYDKAIKLNPKYVEAYIARGRSYARIGEYKNAITDADEAIRLKTDHAAAYNNRGIAYIFIGNNLEGCSSLIRACELGNCKGYKYAKQNGICQHGVSVPRSPEKQSPPPMESAKPSVDADQRYKGIKGIELANGNVIEGQILSWNPDKIKIQTKDGRVLSYDFKKEVHRVITE